MTRSIRWCVLALLVAASAAARAEGADPPAQPGAPEPEVLIKRTRHGGWGGPVVQVSTVRDRAAVFVGGRGGWLLDGRFTIGGAGFGMVNRIPAPPAVEDPGEELELEMAYGGAWLEYTARPVRLVHVSFGVLVGGGGVTLAFRDGGSVGSGSDGFFVTEPAIFGELNLTKSIRLDLGAAYRWIAGVDLPGLSYSDVAGFSVLAALKFGKF